MSSVDPGWYKDPADPTTQRYWDGEGWIGAPIPADATPPEGPPPVEEPPATPESGEAQQPAPPAGAPWAPGSYGTPYPPPGTPYPPTGAPYPPPGAPYPPPGAPFPPPGGHPGHVPPPGAGVPPGMPPPGYPPYGYPAPPPPRPHGHALAPLGARLAARLIDIGMVLLLNIAVNGWFVWQYLQEMSPFFKEVWRRAQAGDQSTEGLPVASDRASSLQMVIVLLAAALWWAYEVPATANTGQTLGKRIMGIRVMRLEQDAPLGFGRSFRRWNTLGLPTLLWVCCIGFVLQFIDSVFVLFDRPLRQALHDKSAHTVVVRVAPVPGAPETGPAPRTEPPGGSA